MIACFSKKRRMSQVFRNMNPTIVSQFHQYGAERAQFFKRAKLIQFLAKRAELVRILLSKVGMAYSFSFLS